MIGSSPDCFDCFSNDLASYPAGLQSLLARWLASMTVLRYLLVSRRSSPVQSSQALSLGVRLSAIAIVVVEEEAVMITM